MGEDELDVEVQPDESGKLPEVVPTAKYIGVKEAWGKAKGKVASLEEQVKDLTDKLGKGVSSEELTKVKQELEETKVNLQKTSDELKSIKDKSVGDKREFLKSKGIPDEELADATEKDLDILIKAIGAYKPKPDLGGGGGSGSLPESPLELFRMAKTKTK